MKKYLPAILIIILLSLGIIAGLILVQRNQQLNQKASSPTGSATVSISPATSSFQRNTPNTVSVYFNTANISTSGVTVRLNYANLGINVSGIQINPALLASGDWTCPIKTITPNGSTSQIDIACINTSTGGYSNSSDTLLATFTLTASQVPSQNPVIMSFDTQESKITQKSDAQDILLTPASTGSFTITDTIAQSPTATPIVIVASPTATPTTAPGATATPLATATASPIATATAVGATATPVPTATAHTTGSASPTNPPLPVTGFDTPTIIGGVGGIIMLLVGAAALIL
jgi:Cu/Ag efflux protein CusF